MFGRGRRLPQWPATPGIGADQHLRESFDILRRKWSEIPHGELDRIRSERLLEMSDEQLLLDWSLARDHASKGTAYSVRGWYQTLYKDIFRGRKVMDVGSGLAFDSIGYAENGADLTFVDISASNLEVIERLCRLKQLPRVRFCYLEDLRSLDALPDDYDAIYCQGSLINAPLDVTRLEARALLQHLPVGGRWIELAYPKERWIREGRMPFDQWGAKTDGGAPWMEWHDLQTVLGFLAPATFEVVFTVNFHNDDFNWFDLLRRS